MYQLKKMIDSQSFDTWINNMQFIDLEDNKLIFQVPTRFFAEYVDAQYAQMIVKVYKDQFAEEVTLHYRIPKAIDKRTQRSPHKSGKKDPINVSKSPKITNDDFNSRLKTSYTFDSLVEASFNKTARQVGLSIAKMSKNFNPFFIYGCVGLGKTHLINAIGNKIVSDFHGKRVLYLTAREFKDQYVQAALKDKNLPELLNFYQSLDVLIVDDVQFLSGQNKTQEAFFQIFNILHRDQKQIILTSDRPPIKIKDVSDSLISRFGSGITAEVEKPNTAEMMEVIRYKLINDYASVEMRAETIEYIASKIKDIRTLEGVLNSMVTSNTFNQMDLSVDFAKSIIANHVKIEEKRIDIPLILNTVSNYFDISVEDIHSRSRKRDITDARQIAMYCAYHYTKTTLTSIGIAIAKRSHATVKHAITKVEDRKETCKKFAADLAKIESILKN